MIWGIFAVVGLMLFGSIYWLKPSPRDQRLAALRLAAIKLGLQVRHHNFQPDMAKTGVREAITGTSYSRMKNPGKPQGNLLFRIVGQPAWDNEALPDGLSWHDKPADVQKTGQQISSLLLGWPDKLYLLEVYENRVMLMAAENREATAEVYANVIDTFLG
ncbi:hypothetical protein [Parathalassolituus penaei]|uniref:Uncharacterized protein n=1 Tax=Parathalassolituus penaei TaxID=2997323 RepID=A0A9X3ITM9_9GAMM|nr:hypothetical protein [Parathalassolituus penaei]MCY0966485.1 hypothetical protein [Parathalassolituus penaei]